MRGVLRVAVAFGLSLIFGWGIAAQAPPPNPPPPAPKQPLHPAFLLDQTRLGKCLAMAKVTVMRKRDPYGATGQWHWFRDPIRDVRGPMTMPTGGQEDALLFSATCEAPEVRIYLASWYAVLHKASLEKLLKPVLTDAFQGVFSVQVTYALPRPTDAKLPEAKYTLTNDKGAVIPQIAAEQQPDMLRALAGFFTDIDRDWQDTWLRPWGYEFHRFRFFYTSYRPGGACYIPPTSKFLTLHIQTPMKDVAINFNIPKDTAF